MSTETFAQLLESHYRRELSEQPAEWTVSPALHRKITEDGRMQPFCGATTVLKLNEEDKLKCRALRDRLLEDLDLPLVVILPETYHVTVHALSNPYNVEGGSTEAVLADIARREEAVAALFRSVRKEYGGEKIRLRTLGPSTSGKDVVSLKFAPSGERDSAILGDLFQRLESLLPLHKIYVPHVSLAYFVPRPYDAKQIAALYSRLRELDSDSFRFELALDVMELAYQRHTDMHDFRDVFTVRSV
ncbi:hypothetical protein [Paenibacillus hamazuiensis]|uniref:hypothetical protein n=1 Tax=Paenibacillus hamazuiensis TaxID=2936508 RepID=UPI00200FC073|nr:hypothetical protein [Paenibacillus hamazuiensis]